MNKQIQRLSDMEMSQFMDRSCQELAVSDQTYLKDYADEKELEQRYESLELSLGQRRLINDYIACIKSADMRYSEISYMAGVRDTIHKFAHLGLL